VSLKHVILTLIHQAPSTGYEINKSFEQKIGYFWHASHQQVYQELAKLKKTEMLTCEHKPQTDKPDKKIYSITVKGRDELRKWLHQSLPEKKYKDILLVRLLSADLLPLDKLCEQIQKAAEFEQHRLDEFLHIQKQCYSDEQKKYLSALDKRLFINMRKGILLAEAELAWAKEALETLQN